MTTLSFTTVQKFKLSIEDTDCGYDRYNITLTNLVKGFCHMVVLKHDTIPEFILNSSEEALAKKGGATVYSQGDSCIDINRLNDNSFEVFFGRYRESDCESGVIAYLDRTQLSEFRKALFDAYCVKEEQNL